MSDESGSPKPARARSQRRLKATRQKLIKAARAVFAEKGLDLTRIDDITEKADIGKGTFYNYFKSKEQVIRELIKELLQELTAFIEATCSGEHDLTGLLDKLIGAHIQFFSSRWEDFVVYFQGRTDLTLEQGYSGIETPFLDYLTRVESLLASRITYRLPQTVLRRIACAVAGFVSGYYSFAVIASLDEDIDATFVSLRTAMAASMARFIQEASPTPELQEKRTDVG
jgi:AcrR family transcriptional regulator